MLVDVKINTIADFPHVKREEVSEEVWNDMIELLDSVVHLDTGMYQIPAFNADVHTDDIQNSDHIRLETFQGYGVCDTPEQAVTYLGLRGLPDPYVIFFTEITKADEPKTDGWRWHKWGPYIGTQNPQCEYIADEPEIERVFVFEVYPVKR